MESIAIVSALGTSRGQTSSMIDAIFSNCSVPLTWIVEVSDPIGASWALPMVQLTSSKQRLHLSLRFKRELLHEPLKNWFIFKPYPCAVKIKNKRLLLDIFSNVSLSYPLSIPSTTHLIHPVSSMMDWAVISLSPLLCLLWRHPNTWQNASVRFWWPRWSSLAAWMLAHTQEQMALKDIDEISDFPWMVVL